MARTTTARTIITRNSRISIIVNSRTWGCAGLVVGGWVVIIIGWIVVVVVVMVVVVVVLVVVTVVVVKHSGLM